MQKLNCPECGNEMNHHANKMDFNDADQTLSDSDDGGVMREVHTCPHCGHISTRLAPS